MPTTYKRTTSTQEGAADVVFVELSDKRETKGTTSIGIQYASKTIIEMIIEEASKLKNLNRRQRRTMDQNQ